MFEDFIFMVCDLWPCVSVLILVMNLYTSFFMICAMRAEAQVLLLRDGER